MDKSEVEFLESKGFDVNGALKRFLNNEALYKKCMKKFLDDNSYEDFRQAYDAGNCNDAFRAAHTMKGIVANLGINSLYHVLVPMVEKLRVQDMNISEDAKVLESIYKEAYKIIDEM